jgi:integrase
MGNKQFKTLYQCIDYALANRPAWVHSRSRGTVIQNCKHLRDIWGDCSISMIDWIAMDRLRNTMLSQGKANSTVNKAISAGRTTFEFCTHRKLTPEIPSCFFGARLPEIKTDPIVFTFDEVDAMAELARSYTMMGNNNLADFIMGLAWTGARRSELLKIRVKDIDLERGWLYIGRSFQNKASKMVPIPIMPKLEEVLLPRLKDIPGTHLVFGTDWRTVDTLDYAFRKNRAYALPEDKQYPLKQLRHTFCSALLTIGTPIDRVCDLMCHSSVEVTRRYARALNKQKSRDLVNLAKAYHSGELSQMQKVLTNEDKIALLNLDDAYRNADVSSDPQFQTALSYNDKVWTPAGAPDPSADVVKLVDTHV